MRRGFSLLALVGLLFPVAAQAWNSKTHIAIAYLAYRKLNRGVRDRVNEILVLHPLYSQWTKGSKVGQAGLYAFMHAAIWPDCIQTPACPGYQEDGVESGWVPSVAQEGWLNRGYADKFMHKYWHAVQRPLLADGVMAGEIPQPNLETQLPMLVEALNLNTEDIKKSYDLAWVANLVGELHQPLNCVSHYSHAHPNGDLNARAVKLHEAAPADNLHDYWDNLLGTEDGLEPAIKLGKVLGSMQDEDVPWDPADIQKWINSSVDLAKKSVYTPAILSADDQGEPANLDAAYRKTALEIALKQAAYAGNRLASLLNKNLR